MDYGTGAIFGCPSGDQRDLDFASKYGLPVVPVVMPEGADPATFQIADEAYVDDGVMINSRFLDGMTPEAAFEEVAKLLEQQTIGNRPQGERKVNFRLRDWGISRQRYWGCPIPMIHCEDCGVVPVPKADLPVKLPDDVEFDRPGNPLDRHPTWRHVACPQCGKAARRETDTMDTFVDSSWYFARFTAPWENEPTDPEGGQSTGCRSTSISAASSTRSCICSIRASSPAPCARPAMSTWTSRSRACSRRAWSCTRPIRAAGRLLVAPSRGRASRRSTASAAPSLIADRRSRSRSARSRRCRSRRRTWSIPTTSSTATAPTRRAGSCCRTRRPSATSIWTESRRGRRAPLRAARLAAGVEAAPKRSPASRRQPAQRGRCRRGFARRRTRRSRRSARTSRSSPSTGPSPASTN